MCNKLFTDLNWIVTGRKLKLRHFRDGQELPWVLNDDNHDFDFQQNRPLREELILLPGDELTYGKYKMINYILAENCNA